MRSVHVALRRFFILNREELREPEIALALGASFFFSINDMAIKFLSGDYALHQIVLIRSVIGLVILLAVIVPLEGGYSILKTNRLFMHFLRGLCVVIANMTFFVALAAMPLADAVAIFFVSPLVITVFSVIFLGETVGPRRWVAVVLTIFWGVVVFGEWPDQIAWIGISLIVGGGLFMLWREAVQNARDHNKSIAD